MWDEITNPFPYFNGAAFEVWDWIINIILYIMSKQGLKLIQYSKRDLW